jgi:hypothetical protein
MQLGVADMKNIMIVLVIGLSLISCTTPLKYTDKPLQPYDRDTQYRIDETSKGFVITIYYSRFQFYPELSAIALACKSALTSIAYEHAQRGNRGIKPINEQMIRISTGRNIAAGVTSCSATVQVEYEGYAPEKPITLTPITPSKGTTKILTWDFSVAKSGPGENYPVIATFRKGDNLTILEQSGGWVKVRSESGQVGWIRSEVLK